VCLDSDAYSQSIFSACRTNENGDVVSSAANDIGLTYSTCGNTNRYLHRNAYLPSAIIIGIDSRKKGHGQGDDLA